MIKIKRNDSPEDKALKGLYNSMFELWSSMRIPADLPRELVEIFKYEDNDAWIAGFLTRYKCISSNESRNGIIDFRTKILGLIDNYKNMSDESAMYCFVAVSICNLLLIENLKK